MTMKNVFNLCKIGALLMVICIASYFSEWEAICQFDSHCSKLLSSS